MPKALAIACAVALAASIAHVLIDLAGDVVLAHDAYDDVGHASRPLASAAAFLLGLLLAGRLLLAACGDGGVRAGALRSAAVALVGPQAWAFALCVASATVAATAGMEFADAAAAGDARGDLASLFGGSIPLGCGIAIAVASAVALGLRRLLAFVASSDAAIARLLESWLRGSRQAALGACSQLGVVAVPGSRFAGSGAARRAGKRAPPLLRA